MGKPDLQTSVSMLHLFGDPTRVRLMALLEQHELTVAELTSITELSQSRVSTHLGKLREAGLLHDRREGASTFYRVNQSAMPSEASRLWSLLREQIKDAVLESDQARCEAIVQARHGDGRWPDAIAGQMDRHYSPGRTWESLTRGLIGLLQLGQVLDVGCGDGTIAQLLAPRAERYVGLDRSSRLLDAAGRRLAHAENVELTQGDMHELPFEDDRFDQVAMFNVLTYSERPGRAIAELARVLRPGGQLVLTTLAEHDRMSVTSVYGHVNAGFRARDLEALLREADLAVDCCEVTCRERRPPNFEVVTAFAHRRSRPTTDGGSR
jgi:ArsR family transcriptional regulator